LRHVRLGSNIAPTWQVVITILVLHKLKLGPCKSLYAPNFVGPILAHCMFSVIFLIIKCFLHAILGYFILGPSLC
jgi:hypothetical protein